MRGGMYGEGGQKGSNCWVFLPAKPLACFSASLEELYKYLIRSKSDHTRPDKERKDIDLYGLGSVLASREGLWGSQWQQQATLVFCPNTLGVSPS